MLMELELQLGTHQHQPCCSLAPAGSERTVLHALGLNSINVGDRPLLGGKRTYRERARNSRNWLEASIRGYEVSPQLRPKRPYAKQISACASADLGHLRRRRKAFERRREDSVAVGALSESPSHREQWCRQRSIGAYA